MERKDSSLQPFNIKTRKHEVGFLVRNGTSGMTIFAGKSVAAFPDNDFRNPISLTPREVEQISLLAKGFPNDRIADEMNSSPKTIKNRFIDIFVKLRVDNRTGALRRSLDLGIIVPEEHGDLVE